MEVDDLRELYSTYLDLETDGNSNYAPRRLAALFECCGIGDLSARDVAAVKDITSAHSDSVTFDVFIKWMGEIFKRKVGGMKLQSRRNSTGFEGSRAPSKGSTIREDCSRRTSTASAGISEVAPAEDRRGFVAAVLRERKLAKHGPLLVTNAVTQRHSKEIEGPTTPKWSQRSSSQGVRSRVLSRAGSRGGSRVGSRGGSRIPSRSNSRSNSLTREVGAGNGKSTTEVAKQNVFSTKGLPPSDAMMARKRYRANSIEKATLGLEEHRSHGAGAGASAPARPRLDSSVQPSGTGMRQEKQVTDSLETVTDAIAKLSAIASVE